MPFEVTELSIDKAFLLIVFDRVVYFLITVLYTYGNFHRHHVKDVLLSTSALSVGDKVKWKDQEVTVLRQGGGQAGTRDALYVVSGPPSKAAAVNAKRSGASKQTTAPPLPSNTSTSVVSTEKTRELSSSGQCVVPRRELLAECDEQLAESLCILERRWTFYM